jgi:FkbH-like protein
MVIGSCLVAAWAEILKLTEKDCMIDTLLTNNVSQLPPEPPHAASEYSFHVLQIPLRAVLPDQAHMRLRYDAPDVYRDLFEETCSRLAISLDSLLRWNREHGILTFVCNFLVPQQNPMGRLLPRYDLRNMVYFIERLNEVLAEELQRFQSVHFFDYDEVVTTYGRRHFQDDVVWITSHGAALSDYDWQYDQARLSPVEKVSHYYPLLTGQYVQFAWRELFAMFRTVSQVDMVKLVLVDLDDTVWRGVQAEGTEVAPRDGWPIGFAETLLILKRRGVLLGIVSKNDETRAAEMMRQVHGNELTFEDFAVRRINWRPKADNIEEILHEVNLLPASVVFIDDNPVERAFVKAAFPDMRVIGENPYFWRRILLWSPETQVATITAESSERTAMVQAQVEREQQRKRLTRDEFLASLSVTIGLTEVASLSHPDFARLLELINKTNQFNTTGQRRTLQECGEILARGGRFWTMRVKDKYTTYGLVGVLVIEGNTISQFVMSCRVVGLDVEFGVIAALIQQMRIRGNDEIAAILIKTPANTLCRDLWSNCGFEEQEDMYIRSASAEELHIPYHIALQTKATC